MILETDRLILRPLEDRDRAAFVAMNADAEVMRFFAATKTEAESLVQFDSFAARDRELGYSFNAAELKADGSFVGVIGLSPIGAELKAVLRGAPFAEIGWRFCRRFWGRGLAPEGARAWLAFAWKELGLDEVVALTFRGNLPSQRVMEKIGMARDPDGDFAHPGVPEANPVRPHVLYRIDRPA
ncbi:MAG: GNAT family N-acetyltransferase [Alphaproteobacteria bacterium]|nr:GNAT family N-acetyltransferase [Alphaproteobacteria bacterium]